MRLRIEVAEFAAAVLLVLAQVKISPRVDAFQFLESHREVEFDVGCCVGVVRQFDVVVEAVHSIAEAEGLVPL